jgi:4-alpha-glucanotransferase
VLARTGGSAATIHHDLIGFAFRSAAKLAVVPMQDYLGLGSAARLNLPGTLADNWRWRLLPAQLTPELYDSVSTMAVLAGRDATGI